MPISKLNRVTFVLALAILPGAMSPCAHSQTTPNPQSTTPPAQQAAGGVDFKTLNYIEIGSNNSGRVLYAVKQTNSAQTALVAAIHDVANILGARPAVAGAFDDGKNDRSGGANFTITVNGAPIKGSVLVGVGSGGAAVSIVYANAKAPANDWSQLMADLPASIKLTNTSFGDGVGTIGLPDGWSVASSDNTGTVILKGTNNEQVAIGVCYLVLAPGSQAAQVQISNAQLAQRFGHRLPPGYPVAAYAGPSDALRELFPYFSEVSVSNGGPSQDLKEIISATEQPADSPNNDTALVYYRSIINIPGQPMVRHAMALLTSTRLPAALQGRWGFYINVVSAPDNIFDRQLPTMLAAWNSYNPDVQKALANGQANMAALKASFQSFMRTNKAIQDQTNQFIADEQQQELASDRSNADFDEVIRGYRGVEDTQTGEQTDVNLADAKAIVDSLNENDPGRYVQIPLRDTVDPF